jgi:GAF domain-containing protein
VSGIICQGFDFTELHLSERRRATLALLGEKMREVEDADDLAFAAAELLDRTLGVGRAGYGTIDLARETIHIERDWNAPGVSSLSGTLNFRDYGSHFDDLKFGRTVVFSAARTDPRTAATANALRAIQARSVVNMPETEQGGFVALLYLNDASPRDWSQDDLALIREVAELTRAAVARRRAEPRSDKTRRGCSSWTLSARQPPQARRPKTLWLRPRVRWTSISELRFAPTPIWTPIKTASPYAATGARRARQASSVTTSLPISKGLAIRNLGAGQPLVMHDIRAELQPAEAATFLKIGLAATVCMPLVKRGWLTALMAIHDGKPRQWTETDLALLTEVTERCWAHIERVRSQASVRESERRFREELEAKVAERTQALQQVQKMEAVGNLTRGVAHDFNNLLMAVTGSLELLRKRVALEPSLLRLLGNAMDGARRGSSLTQRMLAFARRQDSRRNASTSPCSSEA